MRWWSITSALKHIRALGPWKRSAIRGMETCREWQNCGGLWTEVVSEQYRWPEESISHIDLGGDSAIWRANHLDECTATRIYAGRNLGKSHKQTIPLRVIFLMLVSLIRSKAVGRKLSLGTLEKPIVCISSFKKRCWGLKFDRLLRKMSSGLPWG